MINIFKPSDVNLKQGLFGSGFNKREYETIASNIILISKISGDEWISFSEEKYKELCSHEVNMVEISILHEMADRGFLDFKDDKFEVNVRFLGIISEFVKK